MGELITMRNIGKEIERKLNEVGIFTSAELKRTGCKEAFFRLKAKYPEVCLVHLYTLYGAIHDLDYNMLPQDIKDALKDFSDSL